MNPNSGTSTASRAYARGPASTSIVSRRPARAAAISSRPSAAGSGDPIARPRPATSWALAGFAYTSPPAGSMRSTGLGFWSGNLTIARSAVTSIP